MKPKKAMVERIATITPIATRNTPFTISLMMPQRMPNTPKAVRIIKPHIANPMCCAICLKFAVAVISSLFLIFLFLMRIQELRELSFKLSYLPLVYPTFFLCVFLSHRSFSFRVLEKVGIRECKVFLITSKLLSKAFIFVCLYISYLNTLLYITALDNNHLHLDRFLSHILSSWSFSHERSVISFGIILT